MPARLSVVNKLLIAIHTLESSGRKQFSAEDLVVAAWRAFPDTFGLKGYLDDTGKPVFPDSNRVYVEIMGSKPLRRLGFVEKAGKKLYQLTEAGRGRARVVLAEGDQHSADRLPISRTVEQDLRRLFASKCTRKWRAGKTEDVSFHDACGFWSISPGSNAKDLWSRFAHVEAVIRRTREALGDRLTGSTRHGGGLLTVGDLEEIIRLHKYLQERFSAELAEIGKRTDERK